MAYYLISFPGAAMDVPEEQMADVAAAADAVIGELRAAGALVVAGGLAEDVPPVMVAADGTVTEETYPQTREFDGGLTVVDVPARQEALDWAARIAAACRCRQEVRELF